MQGLGLATTETSATQAMQTPARETDPAPNADGSADSTVSFGSALRNQMSADADAATQSNTRQSAVETAAQAASSRANAGDETSDATVAVGLQAEARRSGAKSDAIGQPPVAVRENMDKAAIAHAGSAHWLTQSDSQAAGAALARGVTNSAAAGEKAIASAKAKRGAQAAERGDAPAQNNPLAAKPDAAPTVAAVPATAVAAPILTAPPKPVEDAGSDAEGGVAAVGAKRARRAIANQIEVGAAKTANAKTAQADAQAADAGAAASASKDAKLAAEAGPSIAAAIASQTQTHGSGLQPAMNAMVGISAQGPGMASVGSIAGGHTHDGTLAANGAVASSGAEAGLPGHRVLSASPTQLEVGVMDGTHGWLQIRAELGAGGSISTSLTGSAAAHAPLQQAVPEMTSYLASESVSVSGIAVHKASETAGTMAWGQGQSEGQAAGGSSANGGGGSPTHDGKSVMDGARGGQQPSPGDTPQQGAAAVTPIGLGWLGGVSPAVFAGGFRNGGASSATGTGSWLSVRV